MNQPSELADPFGIAYSLIAGQASNREELELEEPEPGEYDPGPEVDDEGGMSEYRYHEPESWT